MTGACDAHASLPSAVWRPAGGLPACTCATYAPALARPRAHPPRSANDGLTFASWTCWNSLFLLHTWQAIRLLPPGTWMGRHRRRLDSRQRRRSSSTSKRHAVLGRPRAEAAASAMESDSLEGGTSGMTSFEDDSSYRMGGSGSGDDATPQVELATRPGLARQQTVGRDLVVQRIFQAAVLVVWAALQTLVVAMLAWTAGPDGARAAVAGVACIARLPAGRQGGWLTTRHVCAGLNDGRCMDINDPVCLQQLAGGDPSLPCWEWNWGECTSLEGR